MFYDDGGIDGNYSENFSGTVTFAPKTPGQSVKLTFKEWAVTAKDNIYIYNGGEVKEQADATYSMYDKPTYFLSDAEDGKVTVKFVTKFTKAGFAIEVTAYEKQPIHIASVEATPTAPATTMFIAAPTSRKKATGRSASILPFRAAIPPAPTVIKSCIFDVRAL